VIVNDENKKLQGIINNRLVKEYLLRDGEIADSVERAMIKNPKTAKIVDGPDVISNLLLEGIHHLPIIDEAGRVVNVEFHSEKIKSESYPMIMGKAPLRVSFAGGGTDLPYFFEKYGGVVLNTTIDKYTHGVLVKRADSKIIINSDLGEELIVDSKKSLTYDGKYDLIKSIVNLMKPEFGFELYLYNDVPPGRGFGSSATLAVLVVSLLAHIQGLRYDDYKIAEIAYKAETEELKIKGGWQDQYAAVTGGFSFMEFAKDKSIIYPLRLKKEVIDELNSCLSLCYVGNSHFSGELQKNVAQNFVRNEQEIVSELLGMKNLAIRIKDSLLTNEINEIGKIIHESWLAKKKLGNGISNHVIDNLYEVGLKNGAHGGKLLGAGGGGYILFFHSPRDRNQLKKYLEQAGGQIMNFNFEFGGTVTHTVKSKI
jgi:D-glycero-alpha-D-manno-heptose-7-phosphate kinase